MTAWLRSTYSTRTRWISASLIWRVELCAGLAKRFRFEDEKEKRRQSSEANRVTAARATVAYHEAGHAVVSMKLGYKCLYATIIPDAD